MVRFWYGRVGLLSYCFSLISGAALRSVQNLVSCHLRPLSGIFLDSWGSSKESPLKSYSFRGAHSEEEYSLLSISSNASFRGALSEEEFSLLAISSLRFSVLFFGVPPKSCSSDLVSIYHSYLAASHSSWYHLP